METPQTRLNRYLANRAEERDITLIEVAHRAGIGRSTLDKVRHTVERTERRTRRRLAEGLGWTPESVDAILAGGEPATTAAPVVVEPELKPHSGVVSADTLTAAVERLQHAEGNLVRAQNEVNAAQAVLRAMVERDLSDPPDSERWMHNGHVHATL